MGTKYVCSPVTKSSNGFGHTNLDHSRTHKIEKTRKNGFGPFSYTFFVFIRVCLVGLRQTLMGTKNLSTKMAQIISFFGNKNMVRVKLMATVLFRHGFDY